MFIIKEISKKNTRPEKFSGYSFLTLTPSTITTEEVEKTGRKEYSIKKKDEDQLLKNLGEFFFLYLTEFKGDEQEPIEGIISRILPKGDYEKEERENKIKVIKNYLGQLTGEKNITEGEVDEFIERIKKEDEKSTIKNDQTIIHICRNKENKVVAGMILEFYSKRDNKSSNIKTEEKYIFTPSSYLILTYLFVKGEERQQGLGSYFIRNELKIIVNNFIHYKENGETYKPDFVFFEVDNPLFIRENNNLEKIGGGYKRGPNEDKCLGRLTFFRKVGARWLDIAYVQPKLSPEKNRVYNLFFMVLPELSLRGLKGNQFIINKYYILDFLISFYNTNEDKNLSFLDFYPDETKVNEGNQPEEHKPNLLIPAIIDKAIDLARMWLSIEIADALDDLENQGYQITKQEISKENNEVNNPLDDFENQGHKEIIKEQILTAKELPLRLIELQLEIEKQLETVAIKDRIEDIDKDQGLKDTLKRYFKDFLGYKAKIKDVFNNDNFYLKEVPTFSLPRLLFDKTSIAFHIALKPNIKHNHFVYEKYNDESKQKEVYYKYKLKGEDGQYNKDIERKKLLNKIKNNDANLVDFEKLICPIFRSYENDLLSSNYYDDKAPIRSKHLNSFELTITFPYKIEFLSEGRKESIFLNTKPDIYVQSTEQNKRYSYSKTVKCFLNMMLFKPDEYKSLAEEYEKITDKQNSKENQIIIDYEVALAKNIVWELVITNDTDENNNVRKSLTEFEIIQLAKFFSGKQEKSTIQLTFTISNQNELCEEIIKIVNNVSKMQISIYDIHSGTIQIDTGNIKVLGKKTIETGQNIKEKFQLFEYQPLFLEENKGDNDEGQIYKPNYSILDSRIKALLEEYLKDNVDNIDLKNEIYFKQKPMEEPISNLEIYRNVHDFHFDNSFTGFEDRYNENEFMKYFFDAMCGVALGIFDFGRMGYEEVTDTIAPLYESATDKAMIVLKRNTIFSLCHSNSVYESSIATIGISPYLIIPNSVLVYNRIQAEQAKGFFYDVFKLTKDEIVDKEFLRIRKEAKSILKVNNNELYQILLGLRKRMETYLDDINIPNAFNYGTEKEIYNKGMKDRGIDEYINQIKEKKEELDERIKDVLNIRQSIFQNLITIFLGILSFIGFWDPIVNHLDIELGRFYVADDFLQGEFTFNLGAIILTLLFILFVFYFGRKLKNSLPQHVTIDWPFFSIKNWFKN